MAYPMGLGKLGGSDIIFKRRYRWTFSLTTPCGPPVSEQIVKLASRPNLTIEETEINFMHGKMWIPGKGTWETITVTFYDTAGDNSLGGLYSWLATIYDFTNPVTLFQSSKRGNGQAGNGGYAGVANLALYDGCGTVLENWQLSNMWPQAINFGDLDYSQSDEVTIELTLRYSEVTYTPYCGMAFAPCCAGC